MLKLYGRINQLSIEHNVIIAQRSMILDSKFRLLKESSPLFNYWHDWQIKRDPNKTISSDKMVSIATKRPTIDLPEGVYILGTTYGNAHNWSHLWDVFQTLKHVENIKGCLLYNHDHVKVNDFPRHLQIMGYTNSRPINLADYNYKVSTLLIPDLACEPNKIKYNEWIAKKYFAACPKASNPCILYLSRNGFCRNVLNENEIEKIENIVTLNGSESLDEHVSKFRSAKKIIAYHGSLLKNLIFCENKPDVLEFCSDKRRDICFLRHAIDCKLTNTYTFVPIKPINEKNDIILDQKHISLIRNFIST